MGKYIRSELIKNKKSFAIKLLVIMPVITAFLAIWMMAGNNVQTLAYNWWYILLLPFVIAYVSASLASEEKKKNFHGLFGVVERKQNLAYGKVVVATIYVAVTNFVFFILIGIAGVVFQKQIGIVDNLMASVILTLTFAWQIPLILRISLKLNTAITVMISVAVNFAVACLCGAESNWWIPYAIPARMMCIILGILPNGLMAENTSSFGNYVTIGFGSIITIILYIVMTLYCGKAFSKQDA